VPFCERKCPYCDFNTYAGLEDQFGAYVDAVCRELVEWGERLDRRPVTTVFLGGGTPTVLAAPALAQILETIDAAFALVPGAEITCEANPGTVDRAKFAALRSLGVNRLSMGAQSFQPDELAFLGRIHDTGDVLRAYEAARAAGFDNVNLDFIFGLPDQAPSAWADTLTQALALGADHLSLYSLIVEPNTPLWGWVAAGQVRAPDDDAVAELYDHAIERLAAAGYVHYEVSNWARRATPPASDGPLPQRSSRHNLTYWQNGEYLGVGPGAHSHLRLGADDPAASAGAVARRWSNVRPVPGYVRRLQSGAPLADMTEDLDAATSMAETMWLGLRLVREGVPYAHFSHLHGQDLRAVYGPTLAELADWGLVILDDERVRLTPRGLVLANQVAARF
jgi:oxygen-independent coproporphyrinogen-3 oxidase